ERAVAGGCCQAGEQETWVMGEVHAVSGLARERAFERCRRGRAGQHVRGAICVAGERAPAGRRELVRTDSADGDAGQVVEEAVAGRRRGGLTLDQGDAVDAFVGMIEPRSVMVAVTGKLACRSEFDTG